MVGLARILGLLLAGCYWLFVTGRLGEEPGLLACFNSRGLGPSHLPLILLIRSIIEENETTYRIRL